MRLSAVHFGRACHSGPVHCSERQGRPVAVAEGKALDSPKRAGSAVRSMNECINPEVKHGKVWWSWLKQALVY